MKRNIFIIGAVLTALAVSVSCEKKGPDGGAGDKGPESEPTTSHTITVLTGEGDRHQEIDGFGCSFGWTESVVSHPLREEAMEDLYGPNGLKFNIYRGELHNTYYHGTTPDAVESNWDFRLDDDWDLTAEEYKEMLRQEPYNSHLADVEELGACWLMNYLTQKGYSDDIYYFYSVWSPPAVWKTTGSILTGSLKEEYYQNFATYIVDFAKKFSEHFGVKIYGLSGWNEPDQAMGGWDSCQWEYKNMADFCIKNLRPTLDNAGLSDMKIIYDELPWWNNACEWMGNSYDYNPAIADQNIVAAGHAYSSNIKNLRTMPENVVGENNTRIHSWITETCDDKANHEDVKCTDEERWSDGMSWAENYQSYLMNANVNAVVWWAGMRACSSTGENLLETGWTAEPDATTYFKTQRYYTIGHFSRYIPRGAWRYTVDSPNVDESGKQQVATDPNDKNNRINGNVTFSSYLWTAEDGTQNFTIVIVNPSEKYSFDTEVKVEGKDISSMTSYTSTINVKWNDKDCPLWESGKRYVSVPANSVVTVTGTLSDK